MRQIDSIESLSTVAVLLALLSYFLSDLPLFVSNGVLIFAAAAITIVLLKIYYFVRSVPLNKPASLLLYSKMPLLLHVVPIVFILDLNFSLFNNSFLNLVIIFFIFLFFISGLVLWRKCFRLFKSKIYRIFFIGNTAMAFWTPTLFALDMFTSVDVFNKVQTAYFSIHFLITGFVVSKMRNDFSEK